MNHKYFIALCAILIMGVVGYYVWQKNEPSSASYEVSFKIVHPELNTCLVFTNNEKFKKIEINSSADLKQFWNDFNKNQSVGCQKDLPKVSFSDINFESSTLLGAYTEGSCGGYFERNLRRDDGQKIYYYTITVKNNACLSGPPQQSLNLISISKIPQGYQFITKVKLGY